MTIVRNGRAPGSLLNTRYGKVHPAFYREEIGSSEVMMRLERGSSPRALVYCQNIKKC